MVKMNLKNIFNIFVVRRIFFIFSLVVFFGYIPTVFADSYVIPPSPLELFNTSQVVLKMPDNNQKLETANTLQALNINDAFPVLHASNFPGLYDKDILQPISKTETSILLAVGEGLINTTNTVSFTYKNNFLHPTMSLIKKMGATSKENEISARLIYKKIALSKINFAKVNTLASATTSDVSFSFSTYKHYVVKPVSDFENAVLLSVGNGLISTGAKVSLAYDNYFSPEKICVDGECLTKNDIHALLILAHSTQKTSNAVASPAILQ